MSKLPRGLSGREVVKALKKADFHFKRQKGSPIILCRDVPFTEVAVPDHETIDTGTLDHILNCAGLAVDDFIRLLK